MSALQAGTRVTWHRRRLDVDGSVLRVASTGTLFWFVTSSGQTRRTINTLDAPWRDNDQCRLPLAA
jgi:hypothetical protein